MNRPIRSIREAYVEASSFLTERGSGEPESCARQLLEHILGLDRSELLLNWGEPFPLEKEDVWRAVLRRKAEGEPLQYIIGEQEFYGLPFQVNPAVLIPRPETELLVEAIVGHGRKMWPGAAPLLADVGTGSGAIAVTAAVLCPAWHVAASDISPEAIRTARANAERNGVAERVEFFSGDLLEPFIEAGLAPDILVSNPPYIPTEDVLGLQREVRDYEPHTALDGGKDGLNPYRRMMDQMARLPRVPRLVGFELGQGQARDVAEMLQNTGRWTWVEIIPDLAGIERHVLAGRDD